MFFITLERPDVYRNNCVDKGVWESVSYSQKPVTINPYHIVSMVEVYDNSNDFEYTMIYLSNDICYHVTSKIKDIVELIRDIQDWGIE
jgi:hypothetical protein